MKLSIVIPVLGQEAMASAVYKQIRQCIDKGDDAGAEFLIIDNGSVPELDKSKFPGARILRYDKSIGVYPTFNMGFIYTTGDVVAFFHSDLVIWEQDWNKRVMDVFRKSAKVGMVGFIGSDEIGPSGGRGLGTTSNFKGLAMIDQSNSVMVDSGIRPGEVIPHREGVKMWTGSHASVHGKVSEGVSKAAVIDGCAMIIRREAWNDIGFRPYFPPHHFYDRLISTQMIEKGWGIRVIGIGCDHFSGQTVAKEQAYHDMAREWCEKNVASEKWVKALTKGVLMTGVNWDATIYQEAERIWLAEYRAKGLVPHKV